jgi:hypothetical protein
VDGGWADVREGGIVGQAAMAYGEGGAGQTHAETGLKGLWARGRCVVPHPGAPGQVSEAPEGVQAVQTAEHQGGIDDRRGPRPGPDGLVDDDRGTQHGHVGRREGTTGSVTRTRPTSSGRPQAQAARGARTPRAKSSRLARRPGDAPTAASGRITITSYDSRPPARIGI